MLFKQMISDLMVFVKGGNGPKGSNQTVLSQAKPLDDGRQIRVNTPEADPSIADPFLPTVPLTRSIDTPPSATAIHLAGDIDSTPANLPVTESWRYDGGMPFMPSQLPFYPKLDPASTPAKRATYRASLQLDILQRYRVKAEADRANAVTLPQPLKTI